MAFQTLQWSNFYFFLPFHSTQLEVSTTDFAGNLVEGPAILVITVIDQNDNRPIFKETHYAGEVLEGSPTGRWHWCIEGAPGWKELLLDIARQQNHACCRWPADSSARKDALLLFFFLSFMTVFASMSRRGCEDLLPVYGCLCLAVVVIWLHSLLARSIDWEEAS